VALPDCELLGRPCTTHCRPGGPCSAAYPDGRPWERIVGRRRASGAPGGNLSPAFRAAKRLLDIVGALALLVVLGPIMLAVFVVLLITTRGRPLFWQRRAGYCGRPFLMFKFRSMVLGAACRQHEVPNEKDGPVFKNRRDPRITRLGRLLRKTSLDETPQLFQVLFGRMSLVGPRPLPLEEVARLEPWQRQRVAVKPGLTCLWQVSGRSEIGFDDWIRMDLWYVRHQSFWTDLRLLFCTPASVLGCRGAY
jgi:lipopolysaccharide/colanic/teichoic acid biosynthesis glycosyltransferase